VAVILEPRGESNLPRGFVLALSQRRSTENRALIHLGTKLTWVLPRFGWEGVVAGIDDAGPQSATATTIHRVAVRGACPTLEEWSSGIGGSGVE